jgi:hypothetical protein
MHKDLESNSTLIIGIIALTTSIASLLWNIIRDLILDKVSIHVEAEAGTVLPIAGITNRTMFRSSDADKEIQIKDPKVVFFITNMGRRSILVSKIGGEFKKKAQTNIKTKPYWILHTRELPKMREPYETLGEYCDDKVFMKDVKNNELEKVFAEDSKGKRWYINKKGMQRLYLTVSKLDV